MKRKIPTTMASQHPDHASIPYWHKTAYIEAQSEYKECYLSFAELGIHEYKWDWEGKLVDESIIERLFSEHYDFFIKNSLGQHHFLTLRLPNPKVETEFRIGRAFLGILSAEALARKVGAKTSPLFEVILPMTETAQEMLAIQEAFSEMSHLKHKLYRFDKNKLFYLHVIPLFEEVHTIMDSDKILKKYVTLHKERFGFVPEYLRPYVARSDPALNAGLVPTVLAIKIALSHYKEFENKTGIKLYPIIGSASLPFRGGLSPDTAVQFSEEYAGIRTALLQSAFRYDYDKEKVQQAIAFLHKAIPEKEAVVVSRSDEKILKEIIDNFSSYYQATVEGIADTINAVADLLPKRRERVQHIGLFGYSRGVGKVKLPRAIGFTAALYSLGVPPEFIGTGRGLQKAQKEKKQALIEKYYIHLRFDLERAGRYINKENLIKLGQKNKAWEGIAKDIQEIEKYLGLELKPVTLDEKEHQKITTKIYNMLEIGEEPKEYIEQAALLRKSLG